jgi:hypothetical protein
MMKSINKALHTGFTDFDTAVISLFRSLRAVKSFTARPRRRRRRSLALGSSPPDEDTMTLHTCEEEDTCMSHEEEDTCMSYDDVAYRNGDDGGVEPVGPLGIERLKPVVAVCKDVEHQL